MPLRLKDIAEITGFSTSTVSRVLNNDPRISAETKQKVRECIIETGYTINPIARSLKTKQTHTIGFIAPELVNDFFMNVARGAEDELRTHHYSMLLCNSRESRQGEIEQADLLIDKWVDGVIIIPSTSICTHLSRFKTQGIPLVTVDRIPADIETDAVLSDNIGGTKNALHSIISKGYRRIGFIGGNIGLTSAEERYIGYITALEEADIPVDPGIIRFGDFHISSGYSLTKELMTADNPPEYLFIANYYMYIGAVKYFVQAENGQVQKIKIASFDEMEVTSLLGFSDLTIAQPMEEIGREAARLLLDRIQKKPVPYPKTVRLGTVLINHT